MARSAAKTMSVAEMAKREGVSPRTMRRRLSKLPGAAMRVTPGNPRSKLLVTLTSLARADRRLVEERRTLAERVDDQQKTIGELRRTVASMKAALRAARELLEGLVTLIESGTTEVKRGRNSRRV